MAGGRVMKSIGQSPPASVPNATAAGPSHCGGARGRHTSCSPHPSGGAVVSLEVSSPDVVGSPDVDDVDDAEEVVEVEAVVDVCGAVVEALVDDPADEVPSSSSSSTTAEASLKQPQRVIATPSAPINARIPCKRSFQATNNHRTNRRWGGLVEPGSQAVVIGLVLVILAPKSSTMERIAVCSCASASICRWCAAMRCASTKLMLGLSGRLGSPSTTSS